MRDAGAVLRLVHNLDPAVGGSQDLGRCRPMDVLLEDATALVAGSQYEALMRTLLRGRRPKFGDPVVLHGDFGSRNLGMDPTRGVMVFDFEHARVGPPELDFGKLWDRELAVSRVRRSFIAGYSSDDFDPLAILWARAWAVALLHRYGVDRADASAIGHAARAWANIERDARRSGI